MAASESITTLRNSFNSGITLPYAFRLHQLKQLLRFYEENHSLILESLKKDINKSELEGYLYEVDLMKNDARNAIRNLKGWMKEQKLYFNMLTPMDEAWIETMPKGVVLILAPFNYPFQLALVPLCGAIAAGNCAIVKPSEQAPASAATMKMLETYLDPTCYRVITGDASVATALLQHKFDHIFFTGSSSVAKMIHQQNKYMTPCNFELGGKCPVYVDSTADIKMTAERVMWGKCMNMGQSCIAPDYLLCTPEIQQQFIKEAHKAMTRWYGKDWKSAIDLARIVNEKQFDRLAKLIDETTGKVALGGGRNRQELWIEPTIIMNPGLSDTIMNEEIFGPILLMRTVDNEEGAVKFINSRPHPLCLYIFTTDRQAQKRILTKTQSGNVAVNDTIVQFAIDELPFGGFGDSGVGYYHGKFTFDTFTHLRSIVRRDFSLLGDQVGIFRYPPYSHNKMKFLSFLLCHWKKFKFTYVDYFWHVVIFMMGIFVGMMFLGSS